MLNHLKAESRELFWAQAANEACRINVEVWVPIVQILLRPTLKNLVRTEKANISLTLLSTSPVCRRFRNCCLYNKAYGWNRRGNIVELPWKISIAKTRQAVTNQSLEGSPLLLQAGRGNGQGYGR